MGRFINADEAVFLIVERGTKKHNLFSYCDNEAIDAIDWTGYVGVKIVTAVLGGIVAALMYFAFDAANYYLSHNWSFKGYKVKGWKLAWEFAWGL